jgi:hypothetical protein
LLQPARGGRMFGGGMNHLYYGDNLTIMQRMKMQALI